MPRHKDSQSGKVTEILGSYNARRGKPQVNAERVRHWLALGALASGTVHNILVAQKVIAGKKINVLPKRKPVEKTEKTETTGLRSEETKMEENTEEKVEEAKSGEVTEKPVQQEAGGDEKVKLAEESPLAVE